MTTVTARREGPNNQTVRVTLPAPHYDAHPSQFENQIRTGEFVTQLYAGPRSGRKFAYIVTQWQGAESGIWEISESEYLSYCELVGVEPVCRLTEEA